MDILLKKLKNGEIGKLKKLKIKKIKSNVKTK